MKTAISVENTIEKECKYLCKVIGEAIGDRTFSLKVDKDSVLLDYTFSSGTTISKKFQNITELNTYLRGMWDMYLSRRWIRG
ncbi:MAG: hypothetical protein EOM67_06745 [Spirochaetia bacterium]|nr:hypothetical protein [Spirochaetia bacterium]